MKSIVIFVIVVLAIGGWFFVSKFSDSESDIISRSGIHWHADLSIDILGEAQDIPAGIGLERLPHNPIHTHDRDGVIHMEFAGLVKKNDLLLGNFFKIWGKTFPEGQLKMLVNGKENFEFENYIMQDGDKIEIIFEAKPEINSGIKEITVTGTEFSFSPASITVKTGEKVKIVFQNNGGAPHNLVIEGLGISTKIIGSGKTDTIEFAVPASGTYTFFCSIPGHKEAGMAGQLKVNQQPGP